MRVPYEATSVDMAVIELASIKWEVCLEVNPNIAHSLEEWTSHDELWAQLVLHA